MDYIRTLLLAALLLAGCKPPEESKLTAVIGAVLIDGTGGPPLSDSVVILAGTRIRAVGPRATVAVPAGAEKVNGAGKFLLPGLIDLHVHLQGTRERIEKNLNTYLYSGITTVCSIGTGTDETFVVRQTQRERKLQTARLFTAGPGFTAPGGQLSEEAGTLTRQTDNPDEARRQVQELAAQHVDAITIWVDDLKGKLPKIKPAVIEAILDEARMHHIPVTAHIRTLADTKFLVDNGAMGFLHMIRDTEELDPAFVRRLRDLQVVFSPALAREAAGWEGIPVPRDFEIARRNTRRLAAGGVVIGVASDGLMTYPELELLAAAGLPPAEVIMAATRNGARALGRLDELGTIQPGKHADLLLVSANPLEDIRNLRFIERVMLDGSWVDRAGIPLR